MAANKYTVGDLTASLKSGMKITDEAINLKDKNSVPKAWTGAETVGRTLADVLEQHPDLLRLPPGITPAALRDAADKAQSWNVFISAARTLLAHLENQNLLDDGALHTMLLDARRQYKVQAKGDPSLDVLFAFLDAYGAK